METKNSSEIVDTLRDLGIPKSIIDQVLQATDNQEEAVEMALILIEDQNNKAEVAPQNKALCIYSENNFNMNVTSTEECKMVLIVRTDLGMTVGKIAAQVGHAGEIISSRLLSKGHSKLE